MGFNGPELTLTAEQIADLGIAIWDSPDGVVSLVRDQYSHWQAFGLKFRNFAGQSRLRRTVSVNASTAYAVGLWVKHDCGNGTYRMTVRAVNSQASETELANISVPGTNDAWIRVGTAIATLSYTTSLRLDFWVENQEQDATCFMDDFFVRQDSAGCRRKMTPNNTGVSEDLTDFPLLITLDSSKINYGLAAGGSALRFTAADGTILAHEIEEWNPSGTSRVWVKVPRITANTTTDYIYMYYGRSNLPQAPAASQVWSDNFRAVWHMKETGSGVARADSTANANNASPVHFDGDEQVDGAVGKGCRFEYDRNEYLNAGYPSTLNDTDVMTLEFWMYPESGPTDTIMPISKYTNGCGYRMIYYMNDKLRWAVNANGTGAAYLYTASPPTLYTGAWYYVVAMYDDANNSMKVYLNGELEASYTITYPMYDHSIRPLYIGARPSEYSFAGIMDEMRISHAARSAGWIKAQYRSMTNAMCAFGQEETR